MLNLGGRTELLSPWQLPPKPHWPTYTLLYAALTYMDVTFAVQFAGNALIARPLKGLAAGVVSGKGALARRAGQGMRLLDLRVAALKEFC